jgi:Phytochelatin synthase
MRRKLAAGAIVLLALFGWTAAYVQRGKVPAEAIQSSVIRTQALLDRAWALPVAATFRHGIAWQSNPSVCGAASLANVFRSFAEAADTEAAVLAGTSHCWFRICIIGLTLDQLAELARAHTKRKVSVLRDLTPERFRELLHEANNPDRRYIINFSRASIFGAGVGHHSPIGGYLEREDLVFVLDVNRDFQPWLVERSRLFSAMDTLDGDKKRGLLLLE